MGATTARLSAGEVAAVTEFGRSYGMTFQILDDINDFTSSRSELGKPSGQDILEGNYTLPALITLDSPAGDELRELLSGRRWGAEVRARTNYAPANLERALELVRSGEGIQAALEAARNWAGRALSGAGRPARQPPTPSNCATPRRAWLSRCWPQGRKQQHVPDGVLVGQQARQPIDADAQTAGGRQAVSQRGEIILIDGHGFLVRHAGGGSPGLRSARAAAAGRTAH